MFVSRATLIEKIRATNGSIITVVFRKKSTGQLRKLNGRLGVSQYVKGTGKPRAASLVGIYDLQARKADPENPEKAYRCFDESTVISAKIRGEEYQVTDVDNSTLEMAKAIIAASEAAAE